MEIPPADLRPSRRGLTVCLLSPPSYVGGPIPVLAGYLKSALEAEGQTVSLVPWGGHPRGESALRTILRRARETLYALRHIAGVAPNVVFVQSAHDWKTLMRDTPIVLALRAKSVPVVLQCHGSMPERVQASPRSLFATATGLLFRSASTVIVSSSQELRLFRDRYPTANITRADNIFMCDILPGQPPAAGGRPAVLFASRLIPQKGILDLLAAMPSVWAAVDCDLRVAGDGPLQPAVTAWLDHNSDGGRTRWLGYLDRGELRKELRHASVFVLPTYHPEGFPQVIQEAMAAGTAIVATPVRGLIDHLISGENALLVPSRDPEQLAKAIARLVTDDELRTRIGNSARVTAEQFSPRVVVRQYISVLEAAARGL